MASSALDKWKERTRQAQKPAETKLSAWEKRVTQAQKENNAAKAKEKAQQTALARANENAERQLTKNDPLSVSAVKNAETYSSKKKDEAVPTVTLTHPRATTAADRKTEKAPISDRAKKTAEIRKDIDTTPTQSRVGKGAQSVFLSPFASMEYLGEAAKQTAENLRKNAASAGKQDYAAAVSEFNRVRKLYPEGSTEYQTALRNLELAQQGDTRQYLDTVVDPNSRASRFMGGVNQLQEEALEGTSGAGRFLGETALSIGSNLSKLPLNAILPGASLALMGAEAAAGKAYELGQQGVGAGEALTRGLVSGGIEALTEKVPLDNLMDIVKTGGKTGLWNIVKQAATEAGEEGVSYILNYGADKVAGDPEAEFIWNDFWRSMGMGALSGGLFGGGATAINRANAAAVGKNYQDVAPELIAEGLELGQDTEAFRTATEMQRKVDAGKPLSNVDVGRMVQDNEAAAAPLKQIALEMAQEEIRAREQAQQAAVAANEVQQAQTPVRAEMPVQEAVQAREAQRAQGMTLPEKRQMQPLENRRQAQYTETRENTEGGVNGGEEVYLRTGSQRYDGADPGGQVRQLEESAGRDPGGQDTGLRPKDGGAAALRSGKQVTTGALGITGGAVNDSVRIVTGGETEATKAAKTLAKERGLRLTLFTGGNLHINGEECRAYITGDRVFVRADHSEFDASQLMRHEVTHDRIAKGEIDIKAATETIRKRLGGRNNVQRAAQTYASAFAGADMTVEEALEEIICDSMGDMNVFSDTAAETAFGEVLEITREAVSENSVESKTGPPVEGKASRDKVNKTKWAEKDGLIDYREQSAFFHRVADIKKLGHKAPKTHDGKYIVDLGNKLMITDANWRSPSLDAVIVLNDNNETNMRMAKDVVFNEMADRGRYHYAEQIIEEMYGDGYAKFFYSGDRASDEGKIARGEGANRGGDFKKSQVKEDLAALGVEEVKGTVGKASRESWSKTDKKRLLNDLIKAGFSESDSRKWIEDVNSISAIIAADADRLDYVAADNQRMLKDNDEYVTTLDASTLCAKRLLYQGTYNAIQHALPDMPLMSDDVVQIRKMMADAGYEVPCGICYVESRRRTLGKYAEEWLNGYKAQGYQPKLEDVTTTDGLEQMRKRHPEVYDSFVAAMKKKGTANPKVVELRTDYREDIRRLTKGQIAKEIRIGGQRIQSFSDFETPHLIDTMQAIMDMAHVGLTAQAYTKVPNFAWVFGDTGVKINLSLIGDVDEQGKLVFDVKEGMPIEDAMALRERYSENVGTILVGRNDQHILAAMADDRVDYIIPFHRSGWGQAQYEQLGLKGYQDYTLQQSERMVDGSKPKGGNLYPIDYWDYSKSGKENAERYLQICSEQGRVPKFSKFLVNNGDGSYSLQPDGSTDGYWKLLIDFKMYDNEGNGVPQRKVTPTFNMEEARRVLSEYDGNPNSLPVAQDIVDRFVRQKQGKASREAKREDVLKAVEQLLKEYGAIEPGENPFRTVQVPVQTDDDKNVSKTVRTILEAEATPEEMIPDVQALIVDGALSFESYTDEQAIADATAKLTDKGWSKTFSNWLRDMDKGIVSKENTVTGWALYNNAANSGDTETALTILEKMVGHQRNAAQALQATRVLKKLSPETQLYGVQRSIEDLQDELNERYGEDKAPKLKVDPELGKKFLEATTEQERNDALKEIYHDVGRQMPSTFKDKWNAWRYLAMLGNPRTHVRNVVGNAGFAPLVAAKNLTATAIESVVSRASGGKIGRTKALIGTGKSDRALLKAAWEDYANVADVVSNGGKYSELQSEKQQIREGQVIFKNKALEKARVFNSKMLEKEDVWFSQPHYAAALASYCKANGIKPEQIAKGGKLADKARAYAIKEAQKATYKDTNQLSQVFGEIGKRWRTDKQNGLKRAIGIGIEGVLPFRKTPANILARGLEYSPVGLLNGVKKAVVDVQKGDVAAAEAIDNIAAGLTGTGLLAFGVFLAAQGLVRGRGEDDEKEREFAELQGHQAYSMELPNGTSVTLDWLAPEALPFFIGVNLYEMTTGKKEEISAESLIGAVGSVTEPLLEMSCLQSLNDLLDSVSYAGNNDLSSTMAVLASAATSYLTQAIPTLGGQIERTSQDVRMSTYTDKNNRWVPKDLQYTLGKATSRIPGVDYGQVPYIDAWGRTESTGSKAGNAFNNFLNPAYTDQIGTSDMEEELKRLYRTDAAEGKSIFPTGAKRYVGSGDTRKDLTAEEYVQYATEKGQTAYDILTELVESELYAGASDEDRASVVDKTHTLASQAARAAVQEDFSPDSWVRAAMEADTVGLSEGDVILYRLALEMVNDNSSVSQDDAEAAIGMLEGLSKTQKAYLWQTTNTGWKEKNNPWK